MLRKLAQCERMAIDATEGEQKLSYMESRHEHLLQLLQAGMSSTAIPAAITTALDSSASPSRSQEPTTADGTKKTTRKKRSEKTTAQPVVPAQAAEAPEVSAPKPKRSRKQQVNVAAGVSAEPLPIAQLLACETAGANTEPTTEPEGQLVSQKKSSRRVGLPLA